MYDKYIDLHVHSKYSDGKNSIEYIAFKAIQNNIGVISLAEHYNLSSYRAFKRLVKDFIEVIPAIELSASLLPFGLGKKHVCHILAYYPSTKIYAILDDYEISRKKCVRSTINLLQKNGIDISYSKILKTARDKQSVGRFDIAIALAALGYSPTPANAYSKFLDVNSPVYIDREKMDIENLIHQISLCGGLPVLAHPRTVHLLDSDFIDFISKLKSYGLVGMEVYNPHNSQEKRDFFNSICSEFDLVPTVGSDYHGRSGDNIEIGLGLENNLEITDYSIIQNLKKRKQSLFY